MEITINLEKLLDEQLTVNQYIYLFLLYKNQPSDRYIDIIEELSERELKYLVKNEYIRESNWTLRAKGLELFETQLDDFTYFVETYRNLFPKGVKSGNGVPIRGDKHGIGKKMEWFLRTYPEYSKTIVLEATARYVVEMSRKIPAYSYMTQADYFIQKDGLSKLAAYCEEYVNKVLPTIATGEKRL